MSGDSDAVANDVKPVDGVQAQSTGLQDALTVLEGSFITLAEAVSESSRYANLLALSLGKVERAVRQHHAALGTFKALARLS